MQLATHTHQPPFPLSKGAVWPLFPGPHSPALGESRHTSIREGLNLGALYPIIIIKSIIVSSPRRGQNGDDVAQATRFMGFGDSERKFSLASCHFPIDKEPQLFEAFAQPNGFCPAPVLRDGWEGRRPLLCSILFPAPDIERGERELHSVWRWCNARPSWTKLGFLFLHILSTQEVETNRA